MLRPLTTSFRKRWFIEFSSLHRKIGDLAIVMKFKFCADGDCPLWALAALHALGSLPAQLFRDLLHQILEEKDEDAIMEILKETSLSSRDESARAAAAVRWVLTSAWSCSCSGTQLARDLAVLGVPRAHAAALAQAATERGGTYAEGVRAQGFAVNKLTDITVSPAPEGSIDAYKLTLHSETAGALRRSELLIDKTQAKDLLDQLREVYSKMEEMEQQ